MTIFGNYAKYYDLLYKDKNYQAEADYIKSLITKHAPTPKKVQTILDIGCGTGIHDEFLVKKGYKLTGIDLSKEMIDIAKLKKNNNLKFHVGDATNFNLNQKFDVILSLFNVINYHISNENLYKSFENVIKHLKKDGLFIFDTWYGPAVLTDLPSQRTKEMEDKNITVIRTARPKMYPNENRVDVNYEIWIFDKKYKKLDKIKETHKVRYLFKPEIEELFKANGLELVACEEWLTGRKTEFDTWNVCCVGRLK